MKRLPKILVATCAALALSSSLALAAEGPAKAVPVHAGAPMAGHLAHPGARGPMGSMALAALSPEKQEIARKLMFEHGQALFPLHQSLYAKGVELEALNAAGEGESAKARSVIREIADLNAKMLTENARFRTRMFKETGLRVPVMGHGPMGGGMMMGGMMGGGMMGGQGGCGMMQKMMGGMDHAGPGIQTGPQTGLQTGHSAGHQTGATMDADHAN